MRRPPRPAGATPRSSWPVSAPASSAGRAQPSRGGRFAARNAPATGRRERLRSTSAPTSPTPSSATKLPSTTTSSSSRSGWSCSSRRRGSGDRSATTTRRAASASTASRDLTSTAPSPTTTSSRTCSRSGTCSPPPTASPATRTSRPSSVPASSRSASTQAVVAAEVGHPDLAYAYFGEAALMDPHDIEHNARDGVHIAALAGAWLAAVAGFGGMRDHDGFLSFAPRLPPRLERLAFGLRFRGRVLKVAATKTEAMYSLNEGEPLELSHYGKRITVSTERSITRPIRPKDPRDPPPSPPPGREPMFRGREREEGS